MKAEADSAPTKVLLVEDHPMFRERLAMMISRDLRMEVCGEAGNVRDALRLVRETEPDVVVVDITLQGSSGLELIKDLKAMRGKIPILVLSMHDEALYAERALKAGAQGYITKTEAAAEVREAILKVLGGEVYLSGRMTSHLLQRLSGSTAEPAATGIASLTDRELEVFRLFGSGQNSREIAEQLGLGESTVNSYRFRIRAKLRIKNAAELYSVASNWISAQQT